MGRKQAREGTMQVLFQMTLMDDYSRESLELFLRNFNYSDSEKEYIIHAHENIVDKMDIIDGHIENHLEGWQIDRIAKVDLSALRIAIYEVLYREDIPIEVAINEAIEIVKKYSNEDSFKFVNGVLGSFIREVENKTEA